MCRGLIPPIAILTGSGTEIASLSRCWIHCGQAEIDLAMQILWYTLEQDGSSLTGKNILRDELHVVRLAINKVIIGLVVAVL